MEAEEERRESKWRGDGKKQQKRQQKQRRRLPYVDEKEEQSEGVGSMQRWKLDVGKRRKKW